ncbi:hypothetical protein [Wolbachia endosymbiont (group A) of Beris morrisii]
MSSQCLYDVIPVSSTGMTRKGALEFLFQYLCISHASDLNKA